MRLFRWKRNISAKIQLVYAGVFLIAIASVAAISYIGWKNRLENEVIASNLNMLNQINKRIEGKLEEIDRSVISFSQAAEVRNFFEQPASADPDYLLALSRIQKQMLTGVRADPAVESVILYSLVNGRVLTDYSYSRIEETQKFAWLGGFLPSKRYYEWTAVPQEASAAAHPRIALIRFDPVPERPENRRGVMAVLINESVLSNMFADLQFGGGGNVLIADAAGSIVAHKDRAKIGGSLSGELSDDRLAGLTDSGYIKKRLGNGVEWIFYTHSDYTGWNLVYIVSQKQLSALTLTVRNALIAVACFMVLLSAFSMMLVNRRWFGPMERFVRKVDQLTGKSGQDVAKEAGAAGAAPDFAQLEHRIRSVIADYSNAERQIQASLPALKLQLMFDILTGHRTRYEPLQPQLRHAGIRLHARHFVALTAELDNRALLERVTDLRLYLYAISNVAEEIAGEQAPDMQGTAVQLNEFQVVILLSFLEDSQDNALRRAGELAERLKAYVGSVFKRTLSIAIGSYARQFEEIKTSYRKSQELMNFKIVMGPNVVITEQDSASWNSSGLMVLFENADELAEAVRQVNAQKAEKLLAQMFEQAAQCGFSHAALVSFCTQMIYKALKQVNDQAIVLAFQQEHAALHQALARCETIAEMKSYSGRLIQEIVAAVESKRASRSKTNELAARILSHLHEHYGDSGMSLNELADRFGISQGHLSKIFKEYAGVNFVDCLIAVRMDAARTLLLESELTVNQIAERSGYANLSSFLRSFKKHNGMTPSEYRQTYKD